MRAAAPTRAIMGVMRRKTVLVAVLKTPRDLRILRERRRYRIPLSFLPRRPFTHIAFYEPRETFGARGKRIARYAKVVKREVRKRIELFPRERAHPRAHDEYLVCSFRALRALATPIRNVIPRRVSFGFTDLKTLRSATNILELYHIPPTEQMMEDELRRIGVRPIPEYRVSERGKRYRIDLAIACASGGIAVECDNRKAHSGKLQRQKDRQKDATLRKLGWRVIRLTEKDILDNLDRCIARIKKSVAFLGGRCCPEHGKTRVRCKMCQEAEDDCICS